MSRNNTVLRRITIILLMLLSPAIAAAQSDPDPDPEPQPFVYTYGFETDLATAGWTLTNPNESGITAEISTTNPHGGTGCFSFSADAVEAPATPKTAYLISRELNVTEASRLLLYLRKLEADHSGSFNIGTSTTTADPASFTWQSEDITATTATFTSLALDIASGTKYVAIKFESGTTANSLVLDDIKVSPATCNAATDFHYTNTPMRSASFEWTDNSYGYATYVIKKVLGQENEELVASVERGVTSYKLTGLEPNTSYTFKLYTKCGDNTLSTTSQLTFTTVKGPVVEGYVCGGGRMADVNGSSRVTVVNSGHLYAVYGGNDIAGEVKGQTSHYDGENAYTGAEVIVGTDATEQVLIDYVYGGGSGLYYYPGIGTTTTETISNTSTRIQEINYVNGTTVENGKYNRTINQDTVLVEFKQSHFTQDNKVYGYYETDNGYNTSFRVLTRDNIFATISADGEGNYPTLPKVDHTRIFVNSDNVYIDSIFGGAENAQVGKDVVDASAPADTSVSITINKGTVYAVFGGNNYGGLLGKGTYQHIVVNDTKKDPSSSLYLGGSGDFPENNTDDYGRTHHYVEPVAPSTEGTYRVVDGAHGIRYLFGGGNDVMARNVHIEITGGQIDTLFAGGNSADVASTTVDVNVPVSSDPATNKSLYREYRDSYSNSTSVFDIRCLFGGNNEAPMYGIPTLNITSGGIHTLYGGGNKGLMLAADHYADNDAVYENGTSAAANAYRSTKVEISGSSVIVDTVYGGGQSAGTLNDTYVHLYAGNFGTIFGGTNILGNIGYQGSDGLGRYEESQGKWKEYAKTNVYFEGGNLNEGLFGGSNGYYLCPNILTYSANRLFNTDEYDYLANKNLPAVWQTNVWIRDGRFYGSIYGGGNIASVGSIDITKVSDAVTANREGNTYVLMTGGHLWSNTLHPSSSLFGGGNYANIYGNTTVIVKGNAQIDNNVYGGNDKTGTVTGGPSRLGSFSSTGGTNVAWNSFPDNMSVTDRHVALNAQNAPCYVRVEETPGIWGNLYGGGNGYYNYYSYNSNGDTIHNTDMPWKTPADNEASVPEAFFCGGSLSYPNQTGSFVDLNASPNSYIMQVFGGGNFATVGEEITLGNAVFPKGSATVWLNNNSKGYYPCIYNIFGGNNHVDMNVVPRVYLLTGGVNNVYGGGNEGGMTYHEELGDEYDYEVGTCVIMASDEVIVSENIYGGCNAADVTHDTYVGIFKGTVDGNVFGGNNVSGNVINTHVNIDGIADANTTINGEVFGGGNGSYDYTLQDREAGDPYLYTAYAGYYNLFKYSNLLGRPSADRTSIVVKGEVNINGNIYGGGLAGWCRETDVDIDAPEGVFNCMIFGGGKGDVDAIGNGCSEYIGFADGNTRKHVGNIVGTTENPASTNVHIRQMKSMGSSNKRHAVFGGGFSGDVMGNTNVTLYNTNKATIPAVYLGGVAADVTGTATGLFDGYTPAEDNGINIVDTIYGGNDFTGKVYATDITINSGFYQHVFGGGNGDYVYKDIMSLATEPTYSQERAGFSSTPAADGRYWKFGDGTCSAVIDTVPYSMKVNVVFNGGTFRGNVYGGGNLGLVGNRDMVPANMVASNTSRYEDLGTIHVIVNDGNFKSHVYGGARGKSRLKNRFFSAKDWNNTLFAAAHSGESNPPSSVGVNIDGSNLGRQLVYGLKQIDMYGGEVKYSVHGGSESVDDGYPFECIGVTEENTNYYKNLGYDDLGEGIVHRQRYGVGQGLLNPNSTLRPSSIVNIVGGHIRKSLYGGGYQGNIYGSVYVNIGAQAVKDSPVWSKFEDMRIDDVAANTIGSRKPADDKLVPSQLKLDASVYNCADWGEAGDKAYFNTRGVFGGETEIIIDGDGYNTTGNQFYSGSEPEMNIAVSVIGAGTSTEGGDINRLIVMRNYGSYLCPKPMKNLYSIQRADKVVLDKVYLNLYGEQDAFESYASPNFSLNRLDTLVLCNDNVLNLESPANYIGLHASMENIANVYSLYNITRNSPNLVTNVPSQDGIAQASQNLASNDILDNQVGPTPAECQSSTTNECDLMDVCALVPTNRGDRGLPGKFNTIIVDEGSYMKISPFVDVWDMREAVDANNDGDYADVGDVAPTANKRDGVDDNDDALSTNDHAYGHVFGYTYLVAPLETMGYVYGDYKSGSHNTGNDQDDNDTGDGGFVSPCSCNNIGDYPNEIDYLNVTNSGPYRTWKIGTANGLRKRSATLIANKEPDNILNWRLSNANQYPTTIGGSANYTLPGSNFAYATAAIELPPAKEGNFYIVETIDIDQANGGEMHLIDEGYEAISKTIFQAPGVTSSQQLSVISEDDEDVHNITFGLTMSGVKPASGGRVTNFDQDCWIGTTPEGAEHPLYEVTTDDGPTDREIAKYDGDGNISRDGAGNIQYWTCWPITGISGGTYFNSIGGYISNAVKSPISGATDGILPRIALTLTYDTRISNTIARDVKFRMLEYDKYGHYVGPIDVTVTISTVIRNFSDIEAPVLAMYNEGQSNKYVRRINIPASFMQRDLYLEDIKWERNTEVTDDHFHLQDTNTTINDETHFAIKVSPVEMVSNTLNNHLGWYDIVEENRYIDIYQAALDDLNRRTGSSATSMSTERSINYTSWNIEATAPAAAVPTTKYKVRVSANNSSWGDVTGSGDYNANATASLTATPKTNYIFNKWSDGVTNNTRSVTVTSDSSFIANFYKEGDASHTVTVTAGEGGTVTGGGVSEGDHTWYKDSKVTVTATPNTGYHFVNWDGDETKTANPYTFTVGNENITHIATFAINQYTVTANVNKSDWGSVNVSGTGTYNTTATLTASANSGYEFANWSDGVTTNPREYNVKADSSFTANFKATDADERTVAITAVKTNENETAGSVTVPTGENIHWYEGSVIDISATPASGFTFTHWSDSVTDSRRQVTVGENDLTLAASFVKESVEEHYDGTMPTYGHVLWHDDNTWGDNEKAEWYDDRISSTSLHGREGIKLGTLDGRAPATLDVTLHYNGKMTYHDHFAEGDPGPLAWAYLKLHWYNNNTEEATGPDDGIFWVKVKLRTREKGDTIYMAPPSTDYTLTRQTTENVARTMHYWNHTDFHRNENIQNYAPDIRNNPDSYVHTFKEALKIYQEGDVIDIMETIEIDEDDSPISVGNSDYVGIQIIRYSGSHYKFPSLGCANPNTLVKVKDGGRIAFRNITFNGSGATRVKERQGTLDPEGYTSSTSYYYNAFGDRVKAIYFAQSPILQCVGTGQLSFSEKVSLINNFNKGGTGSVLGGAIAVTGGGRVSMGDNTVIRDNLVVEDYDADGTIDNYGGAVYVDGGVLRVGPNVEDADCYIDIQHNYNYKGSGTNVLNADAPAGFVVADPHAYKIDATASDNLASNFSLSNVYLKRTPKIVASENITNITNITNPNTEVTAGDVANTLKVRGDDKNDRIHFTGVLSGGSRIGVSKWFPGYRYASTGSNHSLDNTVPRDTVSIAVLTGSTKGTLAQQNFANKVFFNDSNYFAQTAGTRSFNTNNDYTEYHAATYHNTTTDADELTFPAYNDQVYTFYHNYVDDKTIYLQRCASFGKGISKQRLEYTAEGSSTPLKLDDYHFGDSIAFRWNDSATCEAISDTLIFRVGGGFFPYSYHWDADSVVGGTFAAPELYRKGVRDRQTYEPNSISNMDVTSYAAKRRAAECDTLVLYSLEERPSELQSTYFYQVTANDASGNCSVTQPVMIRVVKNLNRNTIADEENFLMHGDSYLIATPGVDSSSFHDHEGLVPTTSGTRVTPSGSSSITATYKEPSSSSWIAATNSPSSSTYASNLVPRYMRSYLSFTVTPQVMPVAAGGEVTVGLYPGNPGTGEGDPLSAETRFCPGSMVYLKPNNTKPVKWEYMSWDFDPSSGENTIFVVSKDANKNKPTVYYSPGDYWWQVVSTYYDDDIDHGENAASRQDYVTDYYGDVTIKTKKGLAWLISRVNGYNGQSARTFHFNTITIDPSVSADGLNMEAHKWTPLGNQNNPFEGTFVGNDKVISNLIVNEPVLPLVGMFGYTDQANIKDVTLSKVQMKGNSYIGSLAARAKNSNVSGVDVKDGILFSEYVVGGLIGKPETTYVDQTTVSQDQNANTHGKSDGDEVEPLKVKGNAIYFGGICGESNNSIIKNSVVNEINQDYLSALYSGPIVGTSTQSKKGRKDGLVSRVENCYAHIKSTGNAERLGGLVGRAEDIDMANCYVYGEAKATEFSGALAGYVSSNVNISNCYYVDGLSEQAVGSGFSSSVQNSTTFHGQGTQVLLTERVDGYNNLLRTLNGWVNRQEDTTLLHWRPAVGLENSGYPLFGNQEMIPVYDTLNVAACDSYDFDGITLTQSGSYVMHFVDEADYLDSTVTLMLTVNYGDTVEVIDTVLLGQGYDGYGISLTAEEVSAAFGNDHSADIRTMIHIDSLLNAHGCDSLVILTLYIVNENVDINPQLSTLSTDIKIYPNPTRSMVTVEGSELLSVEVYDNISRRILTRDLDGKESKTRFDMSQQAAGSYYIRVKTAHGTVVKKLIKK